MIVNQLRGWRETAVVFLFFSMLTVIATWPLAVELDQWLIGYDTDVYINQWADWWTEKVRLDDELSLYETDYIYYPQQTDLIYHSFSPLISRISLALRGLIGIRPAYNLSILIHYPLAGLAMYQLLVYLTGSRQAGLLAGIIFAFNSHNLYQSAHPVLIAVWCLPWYTLCLWRSWREGSWKWAALTAVVVGLGTATSLLMLVLMGLWSLIFIPYLWLTEEKRPSLGMILGIGLGSTLFALPFIWPQIGAAVWGENQSFNIEADLLLIGELLGFIVPHWTVWLTRGIYFGILPIPLLIGARHYGKESRLWYLLLLVAYLFSIGPRPTFFGWQADFILPWSNLITPFIRNTYRLNILISFALAVLVAFGWLSLAKQIKEGRGKHIGFWLLFCLIFIDYTAVSFPLTELPPVSVFYSDYLVERPLSEAIAIVPTSRPIGKKHMYYQTIHGHKMTGGTISRPSVETALFLNEVALLTAVGRDELLTKDQIEADMSRLHEEGVRYLIFDKRYLGMEQLEAWREVMGGEPFYEDELLLVYVTQ